MRTYKSAGVALVIAIVLALAAASAAFGAAEFAPIPANRGFETRSGTTTLAADEGWEKITCAASTSTGEITGAKTVGKVLVVFTGCTSSGIGGNGCPVKSAGAKAGEIRTGVLKGELGNVASGEATSETALVIGPETGKRFAFIEGNACTEEASVSGSIAGEVERVGIKAIKNGLIFKVANGRQVIKKVKVAAGEVKPELVAFGTTATESAGQEWEFREAVEIT
jgi:hypothetical protein